MTTDRFIRLGFWSQLVLLFLVDWGTVTVWMRGSDPVPWYHVAGFVLVNLALLVGTYRMWGWMERQQSEPLE
jgi:hypothetical protein